MTKKRTDGGHKIPEEDLREMEQEEGREMPDGVESQTGYCRFCGQAGMVHTLTGWSQEDVDEAVTCKCECDAAKKYAESKERVQKAKVSKMAKESIKVERSETSKKIYEE